MNTGTATTPQLSRLRELRNSILEEADLLDSAIIEHSGDLTAFEAHVLAQELTKVRQDLGTMNNIMLDVKERSEG